MRAFYPRENIQQAMHMKREFGAVEKRFYNLLYNLFLIGEVLGLDDIFNEERIESTDSDLNFMQLPFEFILHTRTYMISCNHQYNLMR